MKVSWTVRHVLPIAMCWTTLLIGLPGCGSDDASSDDADTGVDTDAGTESGTDASADGSTMVAPEPYGDVLTAPQLRWLDNELLMFAHFGIKTYYVSDNHMGDGTEDPTRFNPVSFDASQWTEACQAAGFGGGVLTAKHHDGFCNWPTATTDHDVTASPWRNGAGDVVREVVDAFRAQNMWVGIYLSAYDLHYLDSGASGAAYSDYFLTQLTELCENYGPLDELWFDGFGADNMTVDLDHRDQLIRELQPDSVSFDGSVNPVQWTGNEECVVSEPNWYGTVPYEADCIAQGNWFWNDQPICSLARLQELYRTSTARGAVALINVSPNQDGLIDAASVDRLREFGDWVREFTENDAAFQKSATADNVRDDDSRFGPAMALDGDAETYWATDDGVHSSAIEVDLGEDVSIRAAVIQEYLELGQRVSSHTLYVSTGRGWEEVASATTIGHERVLEFPPVTTNRVRLELDAEAPIVISNFVVTAE